MQKGCYGDIYEQNRWKESGGIVFATLPLPQNKIFTVLRERIRKR